MMRNSWVFKRKYDDDVIGLKFGQKSEIWLSCKHIHGIELLMFSHHHFCVSFGICNMVLTSKLPLGLLNKLLIPFESGSFAHAEALL